MILKKKHTIPKISEKGLLLGDEYEAYDIL